MTKNGRPHAGDPHRSTWEDASDQERATGEGMAERDPTAEPPVRPALHRPLGGGDQGFSAAPDDRAARAGVNSYLIGYVSGANEEVEAEFYLGDGGDLVFMADRQEVLRVPAAEVASITKAR